MKFVIDAQLPPSLCNLLRGEGHEAWHISHLGMTSADDPVIWDEAMRRGATVITKDEDFAKRRIMVMEGPAILWLRVGNCTNRALYNWFLPMLQDLVARLEAGEVLIEVV